MNDCSEVLISSTPPYGAGASAALLSAVEISAHLEGSLLLATLRHRYHNAGDTNLEAVHAFTLPEGAAFLSFGVLQGDHESHSDQPPKRGTSDRYETGLAAGHLCAMLEDGPHGLHSVSIGNLKPGERLATEVRMALWLPIAHGPVRLALPTTIAPRDGPCDLDVLAPHQHPAVAMDHACPLDVQLTVASGTPELRLECLSHSAVQIQDAHGIHLRLAPQAMADRDVVLVLTPSARTRATLLTKDADDPAALAVHTAALAAFTLPPAPSRDSVRLHLLADCSSSMAGDGMRSLRAVCKAALAGLSPDDEVAFTRFGSSAERVVALRARDADQHAAVEAAIDGTEATLGSTDLGAGLRQAVVGARHECDVLLVTDGSTWCWDPAIALVRRLKLRVFVLGVGCAPHAHALSEFAAASGGACELVSPGEPVLPAVQRMLARVRELPRPAVFVDWGRPTQWQACWPARAFGGDTVVGVAMWPARLAPASAARLCQAAEDGRTHELARVEHGQVANAQVLERVVQQWISLGPAPAPAAARRASSAPHCVVVLERGDSDRPETSAEFRRIPSMLAAGWSGHGSVLGASVPLPRAYGFPWAPAPAAAPGADRPAGRPTLAAVVPERSPGTRQKSPRQR